MIICVTEKNTTKHTCRCFARCRIISPLSTAAFIISFSNASNEVWSFLSNAANNLDGNSRDNELSISVFKFAIFSRYTVSFSLQMDEENKNNFSNNQHATYNCRATWGSLILSWFPKAISSSWRLLNISVSNFVSRSIFFTSLFPN